MSFVITFFGLCCMSEFHLIAATTNTSNTTQNSIKIIYWQVKPFLYWNNATRSMDGIYPIMFKKVSEYCLDGEHEYFEYAVDAGSRQGLQNLLKSNVSYGEGLLSPIEADDQVMWGPYDFEIGKVGPASYIKRNLTQLNLIIADSLVSIQPQTRTALSHKVVRSLSSTGRIMLFMFLTSILVGALFGLVECSVNESLKGHFSPLNAVYWSFVTMTTVGYGDIVPKTFLGKLLCVLWMNFSVVLLAVLTATFLDNLTGATSLSIKGERVAVIRDSHEEFFVKRDFSAHPVLYDTYHEAIEATRNGKVFATILPYDIAAWLIDDIYGIHDDDKDHLSIAIEMGGKVPFSMLNNQKHHDLFKCFQNFRYDIVDVTASILRRKIDLRPAFYGDNQHLYKHTTLQFVAGMAVSLLLLGFIISFFMERRKKSVASNRQKLKNNIMEQFKTITKMMEDFENSQNSDSSVRNRTVFADTSLTNPNAMVY